MELIITEKPTNPTICLNMIVKDESHIIRNTLEKLCDKIQFSYWVICDTGSSDNTKEIIYDFFNSRGIPGELFVDDWVDFAHNRTLALQRAFKKTDLLLVFDADDEIVGNIVMPGVNATIYDQYYLKFGSPAGTAYVRVLLINNNKRFAYQSVLHEYICCLEPGVTQTTIEGEYYVVSGRSGNRNLDPQKYLKDAKILESAHAKAVLAKDPLYIRYAFYCANSYKDYGSYEEAIKWYKITLGQDNWAQEKYMSCYYLYECYKGLNKMESGFFYLVESFKYDAERLECLYPLLLHYCCENQNQTAYNYYLQVKDFYENRYLSTITDAKLFIAIEKYNLLVPYYMILIANKLQEFDCAVRMFEIVFIKKMPVADDSYVGNILYNLQFFVNHVKTDKMQSFITLATDYIKFLHLLGIPLRKHEFLKNYGERFGIDVSYIFPKPEIRTVNVNVKFTKEDCASSKNILIYTGFMYFLWNDTYVSSKPIGGAEKAVAYLSRYFSKEYKIFISGDVEDEIIDNITYINRDKLQNLLEKEKFHTIIVSRYISFFLMYNNFSCYQLFLSAHDSTGFINNFDNNRIGLNNIIEPLEPIIDGCIALSSWHKNNIIANHPCLKDKIHIINNGILPELFPPPSHKMKNKFVWTSCSYRGLHVILNLWNDILTHFPDATLDISSYDVFPKNENDIAMQEVILRYPNSINHHGKLNTLQLNALISSAEYWLYTNTFPETSCITGLEMLMSEVICLYYPLAGLLDTVGEYGIQVKSGNEIETIVSLTEAQKMAMRARGKEYALTCSWENRAKVWSTVLSLNQNNNITNTLNNTLNNTFKINIINLNRRPDRRAKMIQLLNQNGVTNYEFFEAIDGKNTEPSIFIKNLFKTNDFNYRKGVIGCALSHCKLWHKLANNTEHNYYVVLEDDVSLVNDFNTVLQKTIDIISKNNIEYALIGGNHIHDEYDNDNDTIQFNKITNTDCNCNYGYIISRSACHKLIKNIQTNGIKTAIDHTSIYMNCLDMYQINKYLVYSTTYQEHNNLDTDIQTDYEQFNFDKIPCYSIAFTDWWVEEYCGGTFDTENNFIKNMLSNYYNIRVINPDENPDILFYSIFGNNHANLAAGKKVFYSGESQSQRQDADFNITFDKNSNKNCRVPLWLCYLNPVLFEVYYKIPTKPKFCSIICQQDSVNKERSEIVDKLSKYKQVDCGGSFLNNIGYIVPRGTNCSGKIEHNNAYKFVLTFENKMYPGYVTEKICDAYKSRCIPIYWGSNEVVNDFNPKTFINANDFSSFDELVEYIKKVDNEQALYESFLKESVFSNYWLTIFNDFDQTFFSELANNIVSNNNNNNNNKNDNNNKNKNKNDNKMDKPEEQFYSQSEQDKYLEKIFFKGYKKGFYVDVGAHDGITINNTLYFEKNHNWTGINVEPIKSVFDKLVTNRPNNVNLNYAVCNNDGETEFLCNKGYTEMISGIKSNFDPRHLQRLHDENIQMGSTTELIKVNTKKLETIFDENNVSHINYLSIDVEGAEFEVIKSINFDKVFIDIINFEDNYSDVSIPIIKYLEDKNFVELDKRYGDIFMIHKQSIFYKQNINYNFKIIGFHSNQLCERGTEVAMYDYAYYNEKMYGNKSVIFYCKHNTNNDANVIKKFEAQFKCFAYDNFLDIEQIINNEKIDYFYNCKSGSRNDNQLIKSCPNLIHAVFTVDPHGERYATISESLSKKHNNTVDYVPYMLNLPRCDENMRHQLNIPNDAVIMGRYGGYYQFDIQIAHEAIKTILNTETNMYFVFANTNVFYKHPRIIYLDKIIDLENKVKFINTCDAMIHARSDGETFGLAVGEFSSCGKPVITCKSHIDNAHIDILGEKAIIFNTEESLVEIFKNIKYIINGRSRSDWNAFGDYTPEKVMTKFFKVFIDVKENIDYIDMSKEITTYSNENMKK